MRYTMWFLFPILLFSNDLNFDIDKNISIQTIQSFIPRGVVVQDKDAKNSYNKKLFFAKKYLKDINDIDKDKIQYVLVNALYEIALGKIFEKEKINITKDMAYSYYLVNKETFKIPASMDITVLTFDTKSNAKTYNLKTKLPKPTNSEVFKNFEIDGIQPNLALALLDLKENQLSPVNQYNKNFVRLYYNNKKENSYKSFDSVKANIEKILFNKKRHEILEKIYKNGNKQ